MTLCKRKKPHEVCEVFASSLYEIRTPQNIVWKSTVYFNCKLTGEYA